MGNAGIFGPLLVNIDPSTFDDVLDVLIEAREPLTTLSWYKNCKEKHKNFIDWPDFLSVHAAFEDRGVIIKRDFGDMKPRFEVVE
jgi:hypothetical protein